MALSQTASSYPLAWIRAQYPALRDFYAFELMMNGLGLAGRGGALRLSILHYNSPEDVQSALAALRELA